MSMMEHSRFTIMDRVFAVLGNTTAWTFAFISSQDFAFLSAGVCSLCTAAYFFTKMIKDLKE